MKKPNYERRLLRRLPQYKTVSGYGWGPHAALFECYTDGHGRNEPYVFLCPTYEEAQDILRQERETFCCWCGQLPAGLTEFPDHKYLDLRTPPEREDDQVLDAIDDEPFDEGDLDAWQHQCGLTLDAFQRTYERLLNRKQIVLDPSTGKYRRARNAR